MCIRDRYQRRVHGDSTTRASPKGKKAKGKNKEQKIVSIMPKTKEDSNKPAPPKRPLTGFFLYKRDVYEEVKKANPTAKMTDLTKIISEQWKKVDADTHKKYEKMAESEKEKHAKLLKDYEDQYGKVERKRKSKKKAAESDSESEDEPKKSKRTKKNKQNKAPCHFQATQIYCSP
eukprot:TRINITY_DN105_c0_g1_i4.p1 TRINITY_DN105_c0_g1~~TRINITY_DN105_c0_g1_i4.p1  ORF type:complete len:175 (-),score=66.53 TRINITY_DN105_c0_g1_i4:438-962(-)